MTSRGVRGLLYAALLAAYLLHNDLWLWDEPRRVLGLPAGLAYHVLFCVAVSLLMALLVRFAWPDHLEDRDPDAGGPS